MSGDRRGMIESLRYGRIFLKEKRAEERCLSGAFREGEGESLAPSSLPRPLEGSREQPTLDYVTFGAGPDKIILLPGISVHSVWSSARTYVSCFRELGRHFQVYVLDQRSPLVKDLCQDPKGCFSKGPLGEGIKEEAGVVPLEELGEDIHRAMQALKIEKAEVLGISMGGMIAQYLVINHPERVHRLLLAVTTCQVGEKIRETALRWAALSEEEGVRKVYRDMFSCCYSQNFQKRFGRMIDALLDINAPISAERFASLSRSIVTLDTYDKLKKVKNHALVIGAGLDEVMGAQASLELSKRLGCDFYLYKDASHTFFLEQGDDFSKRAAEFFLSEV